MQKMLLLIFIIVAASCASNKTITAEDHKTTEATNNAPDYSNMKYWAAHPWKHDPSDSLPKALRKNYTTDSTVDIFFLHPTTYTDREMQLGWNAPIDDSTINHKTDYTTILYQASIFNAA